MMRKNMMMKAALTIAATWFLWFASSASVAEDKLDTGLIAGQITIKGSRTPEGTVVYVKRIADKEFEPPEKHVLMDQKNLEFIPHVLPILVGSTVDFQNSDDVLHNVFTPEGCAEKFNLGTWPKGQVRSYKFEKTDEEGGAVCTPVMLCNVHPEMEAFVVVLPTPYFATADEKGAYRIENVAPGEYEVTTWHEKCQKTSVEKVTVIAGKEARVDFSVRR